jgi:hypothetical protein
VGGEDGLGNARALLLGLGVGLNDRGKVGSGVPEEIVDPAIGEKSKVGCGDAVRFSGWHAIASPLLPHTLCGAPSRWSGAASKAMASVPTIETPSRVPVGHRVIASGSSDLISRRLAETAGASM